MRNRRAISSVVGTVFAVIALSTTIGYVTYSMTVLDKYNQSVIARNQQTTDVLNEHFQVSGATFVNNKLNITIVNSGGTPINFTKIWITNKSAAATPPNQIWVNSYSPKTAVVPPGSTLKNIGQNICSTCVFYSNVPYHVKLVTSRGNTNEFDVTSGGNVPLDIRLYALPPTIVTGFSTELVMFVINNSTNAATLTNIVPQLIDQGGTATVSSISNTPTPTSYPTLLPGQAAYFKWDLSLTGGNGAYRTYTAQLQNGISSNTVSTTVSVITVPVSLQSGTAVQSLGLSGTTLNTNILILHKENNTTPANTRQMWNANPESSGTLINTGWTSGSLPQTFTWLTNNDSSSSIIVPSGSWVLSLRYASDKIPVGFPTADLIYHFETLPSGVTKDSSGNTEDLTATGNPTVQNTGVNGSSAIPLNGVSQYFARGQAPDTHSNPFTNTLTSTAGWFKTSGSITSHKAIFHVGNTAANPYYDISLSSAAKVVFSFSGKATGANPTTCVSSGSTRYDDQKWHHFVAEKTGINNCSLYVDNLSVVTNTGNCVGTCNVAAPGNYYIGYNVTGTGNATNYFPGNIDDVIHWNNAQLTAYQVQVLTQKTSYGTNAHTLNINLEQTNSTTAVAPIQTINSGQTVATFPFYDPVTGGSSYSKAASSNYTATNIPQVTFSNLNGGDRLRLKLSWSSGMNMSIREDDNSLSSPITTFLQVPGANTVFPGYLTYSLGTNPSVYVENQGPNAAWLTALTRLTFQPASGTGMSYAAMINTINSTYSISPSRDGPLFQVGQTEVLNFYPPSNPACGKVAGDQCNSGFTSMPAGTYRMSAFLSGFDVTGQIFLRTVYIGPIKAQ